MHYVCILSYYISYDVWCPHEKLEDVYCSTRWARRQIRNDTFLFFLHLGSCCSTTIRVHFFFKQKPFFFLIKTKMINTKTILKTAKKWILPVLCSNKRQCQTAWAIELHTDRKLRNHKLNSHAIYIERGIDKQLHGIILNFEFF